MKIPASLDTIRQKLQIDIGFGDVIIPGPVEMSYPTLLEMEEPKLNAYSIESLVAEKFEAMVSLGEANSRMKDFYDISRIFSSGNFDAAVLKNAVKETFNRRETATSEEHSLFTLEFFKDEKRDAAWKTYLRKAKLNQEIEFESVGQQITERLRPIYEEIVRSKNRND